VRPGCDGKARAHMASLPFYRGDHHCVKSLWLLCGTVDSERRTIDAIEQARRWGNAKEKLQAAQLCHAHQLYGESVTRGY
jgi:hypothetical protein